MTTQLIGMKEFRDNMAHYTKLAKCKNIRYIVLKRNKPTLEINPINEEEFALLQLQTQVKQARGEAKKGEVHTSDSLTEILGL